MKRQHHITAFYLETLILIAVFTGIILLLTRVFGISKNESESARVLTNAVCLSENAAEAVAASDSPQAVAELLNENQNAWYEEETGLIHAVYQTDMTSDPEGPLKMEISWQPETFAEGTLVSSSINVWYLDGDPVYTLDTAVYLPEVAS